jgi:hypothetical protein
MINDVVSFPEYGLSFRAQVAKPRCVTRPADEEKSHGDKHRFLLSAVIAAGIIFIGGRFLLAPSLAAAAYGVPAGTEPHSRAYLSAKGIRDIASGLFAAIPIAYGSAHPLGWFMLAATIIPITDATIVLQQGGSRAVAFGVHGSTAAATLIISGLLLFS